jgi:CHAT domain-containing protein
MAQQGVTGFGRSGCFWASMAEGSRIMAAASGVRLLMVWLLPASWDLPFAATEARALGRMFPPGTADLLIGDKATRARWMNRDPSTYRYLHFASHAVADDGDPQRSRILLAGGDLDLPFIEQLHLHSDLVSLSGCQTALGKPVRGEGVIGLSYAFLAAGARAVLVSLWRVDDRAAATFMTAFYRRLQSGMSSAGALQATRRAWLAQGGTDGHPDRWAAFVLVGGVSPATR